MKKSLLLEVCIPVLLCVFLFSGCGKSENYKYTFFYLDKDEYQLVTYGYNTDTTDISELVKEFIDMLKKEPDKDHKVPGLDIVSILGWSISAEGNLTINFTSDYLKLQTMKETLCRAAIVKTLCQIDGIDSVEFSIEGDPLTDINGKQTGFMSEETFVDNISGETTYKQTINATLYFADASGKKLIKTPVQVTFDGTISMEQLVVEQLIKGPGDIKGAKKKIKAVIPETTIINQITVREQVCYIDLSKDFLTAVEGVNRELTLYAIVNSLSELADINKVQFTIDGDTIRYFGDSVIPFDVPFERNLELVKE